MSNICNIREGNLVRFSGRTHASLKWQQRVGLIIKKGKEPLNRGVSYVTREQDWWICNFAGEIRTVSEHCLEVVQ